MTVSRSRIAPETLPEVDRFRLALALEDGFAFHIVIADHRDLPREALEAAGLTEAVWVEPARLAGAGAATALLSDLNAAIEEAAATGKAVVFNLTARDPDETEALAAAFRTLNEHRNGVSAVLHRPFILALSPVLEGVFGSNAPDFWAIRGSGMRLRSAPQREMAGVSRAEESATRTVVPFPAGDPEEARKRYQEALAAGASDRDLAVFAQAVGSAYEGVGDLGSAGRWLSEAVTRYRRLAAAETEEFETRGGETARADLARSLVEWAWVLRKSSPGDLAQEPGGVPREGAPGEWALRKAREALAEAVAIFRELAAAEPDQYRWSLADALWDLQYVEGKLGNWKDGLEAAQECVTLLRELSNHNPVRWRPDLSGSLDNLGIRLGEMGRWEEALAASEEAIEILRGLVEAEPRVYLPDLAMSLNNLGKHLGALGRREEALTATGEAVRIWRSLAEAEPRVYLPDLAMSLTNLGADLGDLGRWEEALAVTDEAVRIRRSLAEAQPQAYLPDLALSLNNLGADLDALMRWEEALAAAEEAVKIGRELADVQPKAYLPDLARSLNNLGADLGALGRLDEALAAARESVEIYSSLTAQYPERFKSDLRVSLENLLMHVGKLGRESGSDPVVIEARRVLEEAGAG